MIRNRTSQAEAFPAAKDVLESWTIGGEIYAIASIRSFDGDLLEERLAF